MGDESEFWKCQAAPAATLMQEPNTQAICGDRDDLPMSSVSCCRPPKPTQCGKLFGIWLQCGLYIHQWYTYLQTKTHTWYDIYIYIICIYIYSYLWPPNTCRPVSGADWRADRRSRRPSNADVWGYEHQVAESSFWKKPSTANPRKSLWNLVKVTLLHFKPNLSHWTSIVWLDLLRSQLSSTRKRLLRPQPQNQTWADTLGHGRHPF